MSNLCKESRLQIALSQVQFYPGEEVIIKKPQIKATIVTAKVNEQGALYNCEYWSNDSCINIDLYVHELESLGCGCSGCKECDNKR